MNPARIEKFARIADALRCPLCGAEMTLQGASLRCGRGHGFDIAAKGYVNLLRRAVHDDYDAGFFEARSHILKAGFYRHVLDALLDALDGAKLAGPVLDAGCGEGYYAKALAETLDVPVIGLDNSRDAIVRAARGGNGVCWLVSDVANLPVRDGAVGCVLNIFTPANYAEFTRVLAESGWLVKVVPGPDHLVELRELAGERLRHASHSNRRVVEHLERHMALERRLRTRATFDVAPDQVDDLLRMTPLLFGVDTAELPRDRVHSVTVDAELLIAR